MRSVTFGLTGLAAKEDERQKEVGEQVETHVDEVQVVL